MTEVRRPLAGRTAVVSGASRGIGAAVSLRLAEHGADLALIQRGPAAETAAQARALGARVSCHSADLSDLSAAADVVKDIIESDNQVDILVCNAGEILRADAIDVTAAEFMRTLTVDLAAPFVMSQALARHLIRSKRPGSIAMVASVLGYQGGIRVPGYAAAKAGLVNLTRALANEWAVHGIRVNAVAPGYIDNEQTAPLREDADRAAGIQQRIPAGRWGGNDDVADAVAYLVGPTSAYVHGHTLAVDGGWLGR